MASSAPRPPPPATVTELVKLELHGRVVVRREEQVARSQLERREMEEVRWLTEILVMLESQRADHKAITEDEASEQSLVDSYFLRFGFWHGSRKKRQMTYQLEVMRRREEEYDRVVGGEGLLGRVALRRRLAVERFNGAVDELLRMYAYLFGGIARSEEMAWHLLLEEADRSRVQVDEKGGHQVVVEARIADHKRLVAEKADRRVVEDTELVEREQIEGAEDRLAALLLCNMQHEQGVIPVLVEEHLAFERLSMACSEFTAVVKTILRNTALKAELDQELLRNLRVRLALVEEEAMESTRLTIREEEDCWDGITRSHIHGWCLARKNELRRMAVEERMARYMNYLMEGEAAARAAAETDEAKEWGQILTVEVTRRAAVAAEMLNRQEIERLLRAESPPLLHQHLVEQEQEERNRIKFTWGRDVRRLQRLQRECYRGTLETAR